MNTVALYVTVLDLKRYHTVELEIKSGVVHVTTISFQVLNLKNLYGE